MGYIIFTLTICCVYLRPFRLPIWVFSTLGAVCAYALGVVSLSDIALVWEITKPSTLALIGLILLSLSFEKLGFFTHLASCITPHTHWVIANIKETKMDKIALGQRVRFSVDALGDAEFSGVVEEISPAMGSEFSPIKVNHATGNFIKIAQRIPYKNQNRF